MVVISIRGAAHLTFEPQGAERWLMAGDHQTGHTFVNLERGLYLHKKTVHTPNYCSQEPLIAIVQKSGSSSSGDVRLEPKLAVSLKLLGHLYRVTPTQAHAESIAHPLAEKFSSQNYIDSILDILHHRNKTARWFPH
jgi:hypothetical protein